MTSSRRCALLAKGTYTVRWHALSADSHVVSGVWTFGVRVPAPPSIGGLRRRRAERDRAHRALGVLRRARADDRRARLPADRACAASICRARSSGRLASPPASAPWSRRSSGSSRSPFAAEDVLQLPFGRFLYGDLSPIAAETRFGQAFIVDDAGVRARPRARLPRVAARPCRAARAGVRARARLRRRAVRSRGTTRSTPARRGRRRSPTGSTSRPRRSGSAGSLTLAGLVWPARRTLRRRDVRALLAARHRAVALVLVAGIYLAIVRLPHCHDLWTQTTAGCCS